MTARDRDELERDEAYQENLRLRFSDNPFRPSNPTPKQQEWYDKLDAAMAGLRRGDLSIGQELGIFPSDERIKERYEQTGSPALGRLLGISEEEDEAEVSSEPKNPSKSSAKIREIDRWLASLPVDSTPNS